MSLVSRLAILIWEYGVFDMGDLMKTTIEIADALLEAARRQARARGTTVRALVEEGLRTVLTTEPGSDSFTLRDASVDGRGLRAEIREGGWARIVELSYEGHGG